MPTSPAQRVRKPTPLGKLLAALATLLLAGCQSTFFATVNGIRSDAGSERLADQIFDAEARLALDIYRPSVTSTEAPVVVFYYGGSWRSGERGWYRFVGRALAAQGMVAVIPDYRKFPAVSFEQLMADSAAALRWVQQRRQLLGSDGPLFVAGHSAGAHIAALLATDQRYLQRVGMSTESIAGLIGFAGPYNFLPIVDPKVAEVFVDERGAYAAQPIHHVSSDSVPALLFHGSEDETVRPFNSETFASALQQADVAAEYQAIDDIGHIRLVFEIGRDSPVGQQINAAMAQFLVTAAENP